MGIYIAQLDVGEGRFRLRARYIKELEWVNKEIVMKIKQIKFVKVVVFIEGNVIIWDANKKHAPSAEKC